MDLHPSLPAEVQMDNWDEPGFLTWGRLQPSQNRLSSFATYVKSSRRILRKDSDDGDWHEYQSPSYGK